jgi:hypothetical protein
VLPIDEVWLPREHAASAEGAGAEGAGGADAGGGLVCVRLPQPHPAELTALEAAVAAAVAEHSTRVLPELAPAPAAP